MGHTKRLILTGVLLLLVCGSLAWAKGAQPEPAAEEPVELKFFFEGSVSGTNLNDGIQTDPVSLEIAKRIGVKLDVIGVTTTEVLTTYLASGELPDITSIDTIKLFDQIIKGGLATPLDGLIETHGPDLLANGRQKVEYSKRNYSAGTGKLYVIPGTSGAAAVTDPYIFGFNVRWDLYKKLGYPELNTYTDLLPLLKRMQELEPVNENGQKVYGISFNSDWDGVTALYTTLIQPQYGWQNPESDWHGEINVVEDYSVKSMFDPDSWMFKGAEFLWQANQMGLLDPDVITQTFPTYHEKMQAGRVLSSFVHWDTGIYRDRMYGEGQPDKGHMPIYPKDSTVMWQYAAAPTGLTLGWVISTKCEHPEKAMEFLNFMNSYDGAMMIFCGLEGDQWIIKDGLPWLTDETVEQMQADPLYGEKTGAGKYYNAAGLNEWNIHPEYGVALGPGNWATTKARTYSPLYLDYIGHFDVDFVYEAYDKRFRKKMYYSDPYLGYMSPMPDDISQIAQRISDMAKNEIYKMIFASSASERDGIKQRIIDQARALGIDEEMDWVSAERKLARARYNEAMGQ